MKMVTSYFQYACSRRFRQEERPYYPRNDGVIIKNQGFCTLSFKLKLGFLKGDGITQLKVRGQYP